MCLLVSVPVYACVSVPVSVYACVSVPVYACVSVPVSVYACVHNYKKDDAMATQGTALRGGRCVRTSARETRGNYFIKIK